MDELNKRVLTVMLEKNLSKSSFAQALDISLPVLTHIGSGRNKPGLELMQKLLSNFPDISPDWLLLGKGNMYRESLKKIDLSKELGVLGNLMQKIPDFASQAKQVSDYHQLLLKEILYLKDLAPYLLAIQNNSAYISNEISQLKTQIEFKVKDE